MELNTSAQTTGGKLLSTRNLTLVAILFHIIGLLGIGVLHYSWIADATPLHLLLMSVLLLLCFRAQHKYFIWAVLVWIICFGAELIGVHQNLLFGRYHYGEALGYRLLEVPLLIGFSWLIVISGAVSISAILAKNKWVRSLLAAFIATGYDYALEPAAIRLGYWRWSDGFIPAFNYVSWFMLSLIVALLWQWLRLRPNQFAINLLLIQLLFFILLRCLL